MFLHHSLAAALAISLCAFSLKDLPQARKPETARLEIYSLETLTLTDEQFLKGAKDGKPAHIGAELRLPLGTARVPAVILIHGSGGVGANVDGWAKELNSITVAAFILDSFTGRGITQTITDQSQLSRFSMIVDGYKALEILSKHPRVDPSRIAVMGFSKGGFAALYSSMRRFQRLWAPPGLEIAAYLPFYPRCDTVFLEDENISDHPIRLFHGSADDYIPIGPTRGYVNRLKDAGKDVQLTIYEGARHSFDNPLNPSELRYPDAMVASDCRREEKQPGNVVNVDTGKTFSWNDSCVKHGATVGYDPRGLEEAIKAVKDFLRTQWKLNPQG
jgi:dienelactone hydrolase